MSSSQNTTNTSSSSSPSDDTTPSLLTSHASYAKGAAEATIGSLASNAALQHSGDATKSQAVEDMRAANNGNGNSNSNSNSASEAKDGSGAGGGGGLAAKAEQAVGGLVGCEGMQAQGREKEPKVKEA